MHMIFICGEINSIIELKFNMKLCTRTYFILMKSKTLK